MKLKSIITVSGRISSGKSYVADMIKDKYGFPIASFGSYLKYYCEKNNLSTDRKTLQDKGEEFIKANSQKFLIDVISHFNSASDKIILEGVRHKSILEATKQLAESRLAIFVDTDLKTRFERYCRRDKDLDTLKTYEQFLIADNHPVELEIESLKNHCTLILRGDEDYSEKIEIELKRLLITK